MLVLTDRLGYGKWAEIKRQIRRESRYRFDHLFLSRSEEEIKKRVVYLVQMIEKEGELNAGKEAEKPSLDTLQAEIDRIIEASEVNLKAQFSKIRESVSA